MPHPLRLAALALLATAACAPRARVVPDRLETAPPGTVVQPPAGGVPLVRVGDPIGLRIADRAEQLLAQDGKLTRKDCSGLVETVYADLGLRLPEQDVPGNSVLREFQGFAAEGALVHDRPLPGDLAFFDDTWDRNKNGRLDDPLTHVAIVTQLDLDGTATLVHYGGKGLASFKMNLAKAHLGLVHGQRYNDLLRVKKRRDPRGTRYLASELLAGLGRPRDPTPAAPPIASR